MVARLTVMVCCFQYGCEYEEFFKEFPRAVEVRAAQEQWWEHHPGCEYLVANPIDVPGLQASIKCNLRTYPPQEAWFGLEDEERDHHSPDGFQKLSVELRGMILNHLGSKDIASLRFVTPAFRCVPNTVFRRLVLEELPWVWEADSLPVRQTNWYQFYCKARHLWTTFKGLQNRRRIWKDVEEIVYRINGVKERLAMDAQKE